ncbi:hypothetical protein BDZ91DRAFT_728038 [Kalaharituber pfeilii]|nr:hypothetical protein BDZ91DRAFT_728038 [Kalaharituber pfeilii]
MRETFKSLADRVDIPILYGISAMGTKVCFYTYDKQTGSLSAKVIRSDGEWVIDAAHACRWSLDIMTPEGEEKLHQVVSQIKKMCTQL